MSHMNRIGVRELRRDASRWLARVRAGESFVITDRGNPIAQLGPLTDRTGFDALVADGRILVGSGRPLEEILAGIEAEFPGVPPGSELSDALSELRRDER